MRCPTGLLFLWIWAASAAMAPASIGGDHGKGGGAKDHHRGKGGSEGDGSDGGSVQASAFTRGDPEYPQAGDGSSDFPQTHQSAGGSQGADQGRGGPDQSQGPGDQTQGEGQGRSRGVRDGDGHAGDVRNREPESPDDQDRESPPMDLEGARANFAALVETYVAKRSPDGEWPYSDKKNGKVRRLKGPSVVEDGIVKKGENRFSGPVIFRDARGGRPLTLEFLVDFSGAEWKVISVKARGRAAPVVLGQ